MAKNSKQIKKRITSVKNTKKITKSMQMIAAVKMQKMVKMVANSVAFAEIADDLLKETGKLNENDHVLLEKREVKNEALIIISANRGLCGNFNANVLSKARDYFQRLKSDSPALAKNLKIIAVGKKAAGFAKQNNLDLLSLHEKVGDTASFESILPIANEAIQGFLNKDFDKVSIIYTHYKSSLSQQVRFETILPLAESSQIVFQETAKAGKVNEEDPQDNTDEVDYEYEPEGAELLDYLLPRLVEIKIYQAILESAASEHSSRMVAMKNATDSATDMISGLTLEYNKSRQASITQEIAEISGGAEALAEAQ